MPHTASGYSPNFTFIFIYLFFRVFLMQADKGTMLYGEASLRQISSLHLARPTDTTSVSKMQNLVTVWTKATTTKACVRAVRNCPLSILHTTACMFTSPLLLTSKMVVKASGQSPGLLTTTPLLYFSLKILTMVSISDVH